MLEIPCALRKCNVVDKNRIERARATIAGIIRNAKLPRSNTSEDEHRALAALRGDHSITVLQADKGNATVVLNTEDYEEKASDLLNNKPFKRVQKDPTRRNENRVNDKLRQLADSGALDQATVNRLRVPQGGTRPALFYGSVKLHKPDRPLRPIVSAVGTATYGIARTVNSVLSPFVKHLPSYITNTRDFIDRIHDLEIADDEIMVSFDVKSLFTSVPRDETARIVEEILSKDDDLEDRTGFTASTAMDFVRLCLSMTSFQFRGKHYELEDGLAMGSPASPVLANLFMGELEKKALSTFDAVGVPKAWHRFVDDIFSIVKKAYASKLLTHLNAQHPSIRFTMELEQEGKLPFLDVCVHRSGDGKLATDVYRKPNHTARYLQFSSNHPESAKKSVVRSLMQRVDFITLGDEARDDEKRRVTDELSANGYPKSFVERTASNKKRAAAGEEKPDVTASIPYVRGVSEAIARILTGLKIRTVARPTQMKWSVMKRVKDVLPAEDEPGVIYAIGCNDCRKVYVGETARSAKVRTKEHKGHARNGHAELSAVANHALDGHSIHWKPRVLGREKSAMKRKMKEALVIQKLQKRDGSMNQDCGMDVSKIWLDLVNG